MASPEDASSVVDRYVAALATFGEMVRDIADHEWDLPTPCSEWNVKEVVAHVVLGEAQLRPILAGETVTTQVEVGVELLGTNPLAAWRGTALAAIEAARARGVAEAVFEVDLGQVSGHQLLSYRITDNVVHAWDLSVAVGRPEPIAADTAQYLLDFWAPVGLEMGESGFFAAPVTPASDDPGDRLLALLGRTPPPAA